MYTIHWEKISIFRQLFFNEKRISKWLVKIAPLFFMAVLEKDEGGYVDNFLFFYDNKEGWKIKKNYNLSIFDTGQNCPT